MDDASYPHHGVIGEKMEHNATTMMMVNPAGPVRFADLNQGMAGPTTGEVVAGQDLATVRNSLSNLSPAGQLAWCAAEFGRSFVLTTSFGIQSAVLLHMAHGAAPAIPVVWVDTGYLPRETYRYARELEERLGFELHVAQPVLSAARMEALYGPLWESDQPEDMERYLQMRKVEPLETALDQLNVRCWASGVRRNQTPHRRSMTVLDRLRGRWTLHPLLDWTSKDVYYYLEEHGLPQHPLFKEGYSTVGDWHSSGPDGQVAGRSTRFRGQRSHGECGLHLEETDSAATAAPPG